MKYETRVLVVQVERGRNCHRADSSVIIPNISTKLIINSQSDQIGNCYQERYIRGSLFVANYNCNRHPVSVKTLC